MINLEVVTELNCIFVINENMYLFLFYLDTLNIF